LTRENEGHWLYFATNAHCFDVTDVHREGLIKLVSDKMLVGWKQDGRYPSPGSSSDTDAGWRH
jgi:hypothetical protein